LRKVDFFRLPFLGSLRPQTTSHFSTPCGIYLTRGWRPFDPLSASFWWHTFLSLIFSSFWVWGGGVGGGVFGLFWPPLTISVEFFNVLLPRLGGVFVFSPPPRLSPCYFFVSSGRRFLMRSDLPSNRLPTPPESPPDIISSILFLLVRSLSRICCALSHFAPPRVRPPT